MQSGLGLGTLGGPYESNPQLVKPADGSSGGVRGEIGLIGVPVGPGDGDVGDLLQDHPQPVRIYSIPAHGAAREFQIGPSSVVRHHRLALLHHRLALLHGRE